MPQCRFPLFVLVVGVCACGGADAFVATPTSMSLAPGSLELHALGVIRQVVPTVLDQRGDPIAGATVQWASDDSAIATVTQGGFVKAVAVGATQIRALLAAGSDTLRAAAAVSVTQVPAGLLKVAGDQQTDSTGGTLPTALLVLVVDSGGAGVPAVTVTFAVTEGGGSLSAASAVTDALGRASVRWTLGGSPGQNAMTADAAVNLSGSPATFTANAVAAGSLPGVVAVAGDGQTGLAGFGVNVPPAVLLRDAAGAPLAGRTVQFSVTLGGGRVQGGSAVTDSAGVARVGAWIVQLGTNLLTATVQGTGTVLGNPVTFVATGAAPAYRIDLRFVVPTTAGREAAFDAAASRWEQLIYGDVPDIAVNRARVCGINTQVNTVDDILILAVLDSIDGPGKVLGQSTPCLVRSGTLLPVVGLMEFDTADVAGLEASGQFTLVIEHEMGHVLGFGTIWDGLGLLAGAGTSDSHFTGAQALAAFDRSGGQTFVSGSKVPLENCVGFPQGACGSGTQDSHWRESVFNSELMTGFLDPGVNPLSVVTTAAMGDLGYLVNYAGSDPYVVGVAPFPAAPGQRIALGDDLMRLPIEVVDAAGRTVETLTPR